MRLYRAVVVKRDDRAAQSLAVNIPQLSDRAAAERLPDMIDRQPAHLDVRAIDDRQRFHKAAHHEHRAIGGYDAALLTIERNAARVFEFRIEHDPLGILAPIAPHDGVHALHSQRACDLIDARRHDQLRSGMLAQIFHGDRKPSHIVRTLKGGQTNLIHDAILPSRQAL